MHGSVDSSCARDPGDLDPQQAAGADQPLGPTSGSAYRPGVGIIRPQGHDYRSGTIERQQKSVDALLRGYAHFGALYDALMHYRSQGSTDRQRVSNKENH
jgi:hypothetical protein